MGGIKEELRRNINTIIDEAINDRQLLLLAHAVMNSGMVIDPTTRIGLESIRMKLADIWNQNRGQNAPN